MGARAVTRTVTVFRVKRSFGAVFSRPHAWIRGGPQPSARLSGRRDGAALGWHAARVGGRRACRATGHVPGRDAHGSAAPFAFGRALSHDTTRARRGHGCTRSSAAAAFGYLARFCARFCAAARRHPARFGDGTSRGYRARFSSHGAPRGHGRCLGHGDVAAPDDGDPARGPHPDRHRHRARR